MARIRSFHPDLWADGDFTSLEPLARLLFLALQTHAEDHGVFRWQPRTIAALCLPMDREADVEQLLAALVAAGVIRRFEHGGRAFGAIRGFLRHQRPQKPRAEAPLPRSLAGFVGLEKPLPWVQPVADESPTDASGQAPARDEYGSGTLPVAYSSPRARACAPPSPSPPPTPSSPPSGSSSVPSGRADSGKPEPPAGEAKTRKRETSGAKATRVGRCIDALQVHPRLAAHPQLARFWPLAMRALADAGRKLQPDQAEAWLAIADRDPDRAGRELEMAYASGMVSLPRLTPSGSPPGRPPEGRPTIDWRKQAAEIAMREKSTQGRAS